MSTIKKQIITIAGKPASGKSTTAKLVANELGYSHYSTGDFFRELASEQDHDVLSANLRAEANTSIDQVVDEHQIQLGLAQDKFVIDARLGWHFIPTSFKVYIELDTIHGAKRILARPDAERQSKEAIPSSATEYASLLNERLESESRRYKKLYDVDGHDFTNFDLVVDSKENNPTQVAETILRAYKEWLLN